MHNIFSYLHNLRFEISFKSYNDLRSILSFFQENNINKINIPCKSKLKKEFLLNAIKISREEFPEIDIIPHFSIQHEFRKNKFNTHNYFNKFLYVVKHLGCKEVLLVSGSQKRSTLDSVSSLILLKGNPIFSNSNLSIGVAFNPYLPDSFFNEEIFRLEKKLETGLVTSIWIQFGTDISLLERRIAILENIILSKINNYKISELKLFGSILVPSKQFLARFKYRPWKGVYCSDKFLASVDYANCLVAKLFKFYNLREIHPIIETNVSTQNQLNELMMILQK